MSNVSKFLDEIQVYDCPGLTKIRVGQIHDGGYVLSRELCQRAPAVYSFGIGDDQSFETEFVTQFPQAEMNLYDPTIESLPQSDQRLSFLRLGIGARYPRLTGVKKDSLLKMDIEWDEWAALLTMDDGELKSFSQLVIEFHVVHVIPPVEGHSPYFQSFHRSVADRLNEDVFAMYLDTMQRLNQAFTCFHIHANNSLPSVRVNGSIFPPLLELSFARRDFVTDATPTKQQFPVEGLDTPNKTDRADIIRYYPFIPTKEVAECS